jgi:hypothetical protein
MTILTEKGDLSRSIGRFSWRTPRLMLSIARNLSWSKETSLTNQQLLVLFFVKSFLSLK